MANPREKLVNMGLPVGVLAALTAKGWVRLRDMKGQTVASLSALDGVGKVSAKKLAAEIETMDAG